MAATNYFDVTSQTDKLLLPVSLRNHTELPNVARIAEADVISYFTSDPPYFLYTNQLGLQGFVDASASQGVDISATPPDNTAIFQQLRVYLRGWRPTANDPDTDPNLLVAMKFAIAEVIRWRMNLWAAVEPGVSQASESGGKVRTFRPDAEGAFPPDWTRWLRPFITEQLAWGW